MFDSGEKLKLIDLIDIELLQEIQDNFAKTLGVASIIVDDDGPVTQPSNFTDFCIKYTRGTDEGYRRCNECDISWGKTAAEIGEPVIYDCHAGLTDFAVPIKAGGKHIASILCGQILTQEPDEEKFRAVASELGIDEDEYIKAVKNVRIIPPEQVKQIADFLFYIANTISKISHTNLELMRKNRLEKMYIKITESIRSSLDVDETFSIICDESAKIFDVQRVAVTSFPDPNDFENFYIRKEYKSSESIASFGKTEYSKEVAAFWIQKLIAEDEIFAVDDIASVDFFDKFRDTYIEMGVKSIIGVGIRKEDHAWGVLILADYQKSRHWFDEEKALLKTLSGQIYIAITQAELYENSKIQLEREKISRNIIEILRSSIDKTIIKKLFVKNIGKFFSADRVLLSEYNPVKKMYIPVDKDSEYLSNVGEQSFIGYDWSSPQASEYIQPILDKREFIIYDWDEYIQNNVKRQDFIDLFVNANVKSSYNFPIMYQSNLMGYFCIEFTQNVVRLSEEDINRIRSMCTQAGIALYHADLYQKAQQCDFSKEKFIHEFSEKIKKPTDEIYSTTSDLIRNKYERPVEIEHLNRIIDSCNELLELTHDL